MTGVNARKSVDLNRVLHKLDSDGWCVTVVGDVQTVSALTEHVRVVGRNLGELVPGRFRQLVEHVIPQAEEVAYAGSLSSVYGLNAIPLHTDTAHWPTPCRYLVIACAETGPMPAPTVLLDSRCVALSDYEMTACQCAPFLIRNGRRSFYGAIKESGREFIRFDQGCMSPLSLQGQAAMLAFSAEHHEYALHSHDWKPGEILIIDNWRVLHGRGGERTSPGRILLRAMVK